MQNICPVSGHFSILQNISDGCESQSGLLCDEPLQRIQENDEITVCNNRYGEVPLILYTKKKIRIGTRRLF